MENKPSSGRSYTVSATLIVLSVIGVVFIGLLIYTGIFYVETQRGLELYLSETFIDYPFGLIYVLLLVSASVLLLSVLLMWRRHKIGLYLYLFWSLVHALLLLMANQIDWFNLALLLVLTTVLLLYPSYFSLNPKKKGFTPED